MIDQPFDNIHATTSKIKIKLDEVFEELNITEALERGKITFEMPQPYTKPCVLINDGVERESVGNFGDFSATVGRAKVRKSFFLSMLMGAAVKSGFYSLIEANTKDMNNIIFDTEQSKRYAWMYNRRVVQLSGQNKQPSNFQFHMLRPFGCHERIQYIEYVLETTPNLGLVIIDGVKDLVKSVNNEEEANDIVCKLMYWTDKYNCHINVVLHMNPTGEEKLRGHLGTEITNKAETVIKVDKSSSNDGHSIVSPFETRSRGFKPFAFYIENYIPKINRDYPTGGEY